MTRTAGLLLTLAISLALACSVARAEEQGVRVGGDVEQPGQWTASRLLRDLATKMEEVRYRLREEEHTARCVPLLALVEAARPKPDPQQKNARAGFVVVLRARDGYTAAFSLAELSPDAGNRKVWDRPGRGWKAAAGE
jgi:hypothetical protein